MAIPFLRDVLRSPQLVGLGGFTPIKQTERKTCAAASVAACLRHLGLHANEYMCAESMGVSPVVGTPTRDILKYLAGREMYATAWKNYPVRRVIERVTLGKLVMLELLDWGGHWVVGAGYDPTSGAIVLADPALDKTLFRAVTIDQLAAEWSGSALDIDRPTKTANARIGVKARYDKRTDFRIHDWNKPAFVARRVSGPPDGA